MLLIIGLDGATWDLLDPWMAAGRLPHIARLRRAALWGPLASTVPPATFPSWTTFMTGVNPGRHGIFDFTRRELGTYEVRFVNASFRKSPSIWSMLSDAGRRVCVLGLPATYPPETLNGCMVSGFDTPVTTRADASFITPATLAPEVMQAGGFPFADFQEFRIEPGWYRMACERLLKGISIKAALAQRLLRREQWDCFMLLFGESDTAAHHFWKFHDPRSPRYTTGGEVDDPLARIYEALDTAIGSLCEMVPQASVLLVSDHGFGGAGGKVVYLNRWLQQRGWLQWRGVRARHWAGGAKRWALQRVPAAVQARLFRFANGRWANRLESRARFAGIDWAHTRAFSEELNYFPNMWINLKGREPAGTVAPSDYARVRDDLCAAVLDLRDPQHGAPIVRRAWRRDELYHGPWLKYAPDIILDFALDGEYSYTCLPSGAARGPNAVRQLDADELNDGKLTGMSGSHRPNGIFLLHTARETGRVDGVRIADMAPTIMNLCDIPVPADFDGRTVGGRIRLERSAVSGAPDDRREISYALAEEEEIAARLGVLGYLQ